MVDPMKDKEKIKRINSDLKNLTGEFCRSRINEEYASLCEKMIDKMARKRNVPFLSGKRETWAASIVYSLGQINFLFDSTFEPYVEGAEICEYFDVSRSTVSSKAKRIRDMFGMGHYDEEFSTEWNRKNNPMDDLVMLENGLIMTKEQMKDVLVSNIMSLIFGDESDGRPVKEPIDLEKEDTLNKDNKAQRKEKRDEKQRSIFDY